MMNRQLASKWDVADDGSLLKTELRLDPLASRHRRKRKASDDGLTFNARRKGRLPPSVSVSSGDAPLQQGH